MRWATPAHGLTPAHANPTLVAGVGRRFLRGVRRGGGPRVGGRGGVEPFLCRLWVPPAVRCRSWACCIGPVSSACAGAGCGKAWGFWGPLGTLVRLTGAFSHVGRCASRPARTIMHFFTMTAATIIAGAAAQGTTAQTSMAPSHRTAEQRGRAACHTWRRGATQVGSILLILARVPHFSCSATCARTVGGGLWWVLLRVARTNTPSPPTSRHKATHCVSSPTV